MKRSLSLLLIQVVFLCAGVALEAQSTGSIAGAIRDQAKAAVSGATITATLLADGTARTTSSGPDGTYHIADVVPGMYSVMAQKAGFSDFVVAQVQVTAGQMAIADIVMVPVQTGPITNAAPAGFWKRFAKAYWDDWHPAPDTGAAGAPPAPGAEPAFRGDPPVVTNPPWPFPVWPMGGSPWIGYPNSTQYPLTTALQTGPHGEWWKKANIQVYGWADVGMNISSSNARPYGNLPAAYAEVPNTIQLDQLTLYIERVPDTIQTDHFDWGFRLTNLYGVDYRFTTAEGYFSQQLLNNAKANGSIGNRYGYDPVMMYVDLYFPHIGKGTDVRIGRYISLPDIEAQLAPNNYTYTHSLTYTYDCYTQTGINFTTKLSNHWTVQGGLSGGCEAAPWAPDAKLTGNVCVAYTWTEGRDQVYTCANSINDSKYNYNNLAAYYMTWYHKFGHSRWHTDWETWYQYMKDTPNVNNPAASSLLLTNSDGAVCNNSTELTCFAPEWSTVFYVNYEISKKNFISVRNEYFDDIRGQRTGYKTQYTEHMISYNHWVGSTIVFRPEIRYEHSYDTPAFDNGLKKSQVMFAGDMIFFY
jgi:Putative beta-barrel porin-2, OmpL-like. bbp2/Carboxypeptidase regulatory-like domain